MFTQRKSFLSIPVFHGSGAPLRPAAAVGLLITSLLTATAICPPCAVAQTATFTLVHTYLGSDGADPQSGLIEGTDGNFYGVAFKGGAKGDGTIYSLTPTGTLTTLYSFSGDDGASPFTNLVQGSDGNFYGTTYYGGANSVGAFFSLTSNGAETALYSFSSTNSSSGTIGANPAGGLVQGSNGNFYGTSYYGGTNGDGFVFSLTPAGVLTTLYSFSGSDGSHPIAGLVLGSDGNFYGTTSEGGSYGYGTVYSITPAGVLTKLHSFSYTNGDGGYPDAGLVQGSDGNFYGTTFYAGTNGFGTVYSITPAGVLTILHSFTSLDGANPYANLIQGSDGNFYGTTQSGGANGTGTVFQITPTGVQVVLYSFSATNSSGVNSDGAIPNGLIQASDGSFYGTTQKGGSATDGTIFRLSLASPGSVQLSAATATIAESAGSITLSVSRTSGSAGAVTVNYATADGTANAGVDYQPVSGALSWADGDTTAKTISVPIIDRNLSSGSPDFLINLSQPGGGVVIGSPTQSTVTILDTDTPVANIQSVSLLSPPTDLTVTQYQPVDLYAEVQALNGTLANVEFSVVDSTGTSTDLGGFTTQRGEKTWLPMVVGDYTLKVVATDTQNNTQQATNPIHVLAVDAVGAVPQVSLYGGLDKLTLPLNDSVQVVAQAVDSAGNPLQNAQFYLDGVPVTSTLVGDTDAIRHAGVKAAASGGGASSLYQALVNLTGIQQILTVVGTTPDGVSTVSKAATLYSATNAGTPPTAAIRNLASGDSVPASNAGQSVSVTATSGSHPIAQVELFVDNQSVGVATATPYNFSLPSLPAGSHSLSAIATDVSKLSQVSTSVFVKAVQTASQHDAFFTGETALGNGVFYLTFPSGNYFGYYSYLTDPAYIYHFDLGYEYVFDANDGNNGVYFYDFASSDFFYTSPTFPFPYLYDFNLKSTVYYYPDPINPGHYNTDGVRFFYVFNTGEIISK